MRYEQRNSHSPPHLGRYRPLLSQLTPTQPVDDIVAEQSADRERFWVDFHKGDGMTKYVKRHLAWYQYL